MKTGLLAYYGLDVWWQTALSSAERARVESLFHPLGDPRARPLTEGTVASTGGGTSTPAGFLSALVGWLRLTPEDKAIRRKMRDKLAELAPVDSNPISRHFALQVLISEYYRDRNSDPNALHAAIDACRQQIAMAPVVARSMRTDFPGHLPRHVGYERLAIVLEKSANYDEAIRICEEAKRAGWRGDWEKRIGRCAAQKAETHPRGS